MRFSRGDADGGRCSQGRGSAAPCTCGEPFVPLELPSLVAAICLSRVRSGRPRETLGGGHLFH